MRDGEISDKEVKTQVNVSIKINRKHVAKKLKQRE